MSFWTTIGMRLTVIIPTYNRLDCIRENLSRLARQEPRAEQVIVVDASTDDRTADVVAEFAGVLYLRNAAGRGNTPNSRNLALTHATGDIIAFLDDDAFVRDGWAAALLGSYADPTVAGVAGRALNGQPGEATQGANEIGRFKSDGTLTGNFAADPARIVEVDHMIGCNMSLRADVIARLGGFRDDFRAGPFGICEETEICIRAKRLGYRLIFNPAAAADHVGAQQPGGRRFSPKYSYYHARNNLVMVIRNYGFGLMALRHVGAVGGGSLISFIRKLAGATAHLVFALAGLTAGIAHGAKHLVRTGRDPIRNDANAETIRSSVVTSTEEHEPVCTH